VRGRKYYLQLGGSIWSGDSPLTLKSSQVNGEDDPEQFSQCMKD
jgi:hypothetical protein